jgi:hypothetical protein
LPFFYDGCVAVIPAGDGRCKLVYPISYDQSPMDPARRAAEFGRIKDRFDGAAAAMKRVAEA